MIFKKRYLFLALLLSQFSFSQEGVAVYSDYLSDNYYLIHPSMAGASNCGKIRLTGRQQWFGQEDAPALQTISFNTSLDEDGKVSLSVGEHLSASKGINVLLDKVTLNLLTTLAQNYFSPEMGSLLNNIKTSYNDNDILDVEAKIILALDSIKKYIIKTQTTSVISSGQRLRDLKLNNIYRGTADKASLFIEVLVINEDNAQFFITV